MIKWYINCTLYIVKLYMTSLYSIPLNTNVRITSLMTSSDVGSP